MERGWGEVGSRNAFIISPRYAGGCYRYRNGKIPLKFLRRHQALFFTILVIVGFLVGGAGLMSQMTSGAMQQTWETDFTKTQVPLSEIMPMGERDTMTPIDAPVWKTVTEVTWLGDKSPVIVVHVSEPARAYPLTVLIHHGVVNDVAGDVPIAVTFCPLCNSAIVYERTVNQQVLRFGTTGAIRNSNLMMWDDLTQSWWQQFTGKAIVGTYSGVTLQVVPSQIVGFSTFATRYPNGVVLVGDANLPVVSYGRNPYIGYDTSAQPFMYSENVDPRLFATERVLAALINGQAIAYPFSVLSAQNVVNDTVNGWDVVAFWQAGAASAQDSAKVDDSRDVGMAMLFNPQVNGKTLTFRYEDGAFVDEQTGSYWNIFGEATDGELEGTLLMPYNAYPYFWFAWAANQPETRVYGETSP
jgi:hypothetical protein